MDAGRRWAIENLGRYGPTIRERISVMVREEHESSLDAQEASHHRSRSVYGEFWRGMLERFEEFGRLPGASMVRPGEAPYKLPVINGVTLFPWRFAHHPDSTLSTTPFGTSEARVSMTSLRPPPVQESFDLGLPDTGLSDEEQQLLSTFEAVIKDPVIASGRLVVVAIASSTVGLFSVQWGEVELTSNGYVDWISTPESLLTATPSGPASTSTPESFTAGDVPAKFPPAAPAKTGDDIHRE
jgi:hypothetical protein